MTESRTNSVRLENIVVARQRHGLHAAVRLRHVDADLNRCATARAVLPGGMAALAAIDQQFERRAAIRAADRS